MTKDNKQDNARDLDADFDIPTYDPSKDKAAEKARKGSARRVSRPASREEDGTREQALDDAPDNATQPKTEVLGKSDVRTRSSVFDWGGRAQPQTISPRKDGGNSDADAERGVGADDFDNAPTTAFPGAGASADRGAEETVVLDKENDAELAGATADAGATGAGATGRVSEPRTALMDTPQETTELDPNSAALENAPESVDSTADEPATKEAAGEDRRGTTDFGLLLARLTLGLFLICTSAATFFNLGQGGGLGELEVVFADYPHPEIWAIAVPALKLFAGVFLVLGLVTPFAAMVAVAVTGFEAIHNVATAGFGVDVFSWPSEVWLSVILLGLSLALQFSGPGRIALDFSRSWARRPLASSWIFVVIGIALALAAAFVAGIF